MAYGMQLNKLEDAMKTIFALVTVFSLIGCATKPTKFNKLSVGMSKSEVIGILGSPDTTAANAGAEYLTYTYNKDVIWGTAGDGGTKDYFVRLKGGKVDAYGKMGDFDSTKDPTARLEVDSTVRKVNSN